MSANHLKPRTQTQPTRLKRADRKSLLLGTALASTLLLGSLLAPSPAEALVCPQPPGGPIAIYSNLEDIVCNNNFNITNPAGVAIGLGTLGNGLFIDVDNTGDLNSTDPFFPVGIFALTAYANSPIDIVNTGDIETTATIGNGYQPSVGILALTVDASNTIDIENHGDIVVRSNAGNGDFAIGIAAAAYGPFTTGPIHIENHGDITAITGNAAYARAYGVVGLTGPGGTIEIINQGGVAATAGNGANATVRGLAGTTIGNGSSIEITNRDSAINVTAGDGASARAQAIWGRTYDDNSEVRIENSGDLTAIVGNGSNLAPEANAAGILAYTGNQPTNTGYNSPVYIVNRGELSAAAGQGNNLIVFGIGAQTVGSDSLVDIYNSGDITATAGNGDGLFVFGIGTRTFAQTAKNYNNSPIDIVNTGDIVATAGDGAAPRVTGIYATAFGAGSAISIVNSGDLAPTAGKGDYALTVGIYTRSYDVASSITIANDAEITAISGNGFFARSAGIYAATYGNNSFVNISNGRDIIANAGGRTLGIYALTGGSGSSINLVNDGDITITTGNKFLGQAFGLGGQTVGSNSGVTIMNTGDISASVGNVVSPYSFTLGILGITNGQNSPVTIVNEGDVVTSGGGATTISFGIAGASPGNPVSIDNSGSVFGGTAGIATFSYTSTTIVNSGYVSSSSLLAIDGGGVGPLMGAGRGAAVEIFNTGHIVGFVNTTEDSDTFLNQAGGVFETKLVSNFYGGGDLFRNEDGGTVRGAVNPGQSEFSAFINLNRFESQGLITLVDGREGDVFEISNTVGGRNSHFAASGNSTLAVDAFLGAPGSTADNLIINGKTTGKTLITVNNTNPGPGAANTVGIPVVYANGDVKSDAFFLTQPVDTGLFVFDLFFEPTNSGIFELRTLPGPGAHILPQLVTAPQDIWYVTSSTWLDRTADLRVLLNGGASPIAYDPTARHADGTAQSSLTPAVWVRGSGNWLDRDSTERVNAYGRDYRFKLDSELGVMDFQTGLDLGHRGLLSADDILVFGPMGGFIHADLDYDQLGRSFNFSGGQVGGYATYLRGGLFVDTLVNAHLMEMETGSLGFPSSLDVTTLGIRTDSGYRFGSFNGGPFIEPLATILVTWVDIDGFTLGGNRVSFDDEASWRGRLGLRAGTSYQLWTGTTMEPFVIGSLWGTLSDDDNRATLTSTGITYRFNDQLDDLWGEASFGVNFFNPGAGTAVFAKVDVTFGDNIDGIGGKAGMRVAW